MSQIVTHGIIFNFIQPCGRRETQKKERVKIKVKKVEKEKFSTHSWINDKASSNKVKDLTYTQFFFFWGIISSLIANTCVCMNVKSMQRRLTSALYCCYFLRFISCLKMISTLFYLTRFHSHSRIVLSHAVFAIIATHLLGWLQFF